MVARRSRSLPRHRQRAFGDVGDAVHHFSCGLDVQRWSFHGGSGRFGRLGGNVGRLGGNVGRFGGNVGRLGGNVGRLGGNVGRFGGHVGRLSRRIRRFGGNVGRLGGHIRRLGLSGARGELQLGDGAVFGAAALRDRGHAERVDLIRSQISRSDGDAHKLRGRAREHCAGGVDDFDDVAGRTALARPGENDRARLHIGDGIDHFIDGFDLHLRRADGRGFGRLFRFDGFRGLGGLGGLRGFGNRGRFGLLDGQIFIRADDERLRGRGALRRDALRRNGRDRRGVERAAGERAAVVGIARFGDGGFKHDARAVADDDVVAARALDRRPLEGQRGFVEIGDPVGRRLRARDGEHRRIELIDGLILADSQRNRRGRTLLDRAARGDGRDVERVGRARSHRGGIEHIAGRRGRLAGEERVGRIADLNVVLRGILNGFPTERRRAFIERVDAVIARLESVNGDDGRFNRLDFLELIVERKLQRLDSRVVLRAVGRDGVDVEGVHRALGQQVGGEAGLLALGARAGEADAVGIANLDVVAVQIAVGVPAQRDRARIEVVDVVLHAGDALHSAEYVRDRADLRRIDGRLHAGKAHRRRGDVRGVAVLRIGRDLKRVDAIHGERADGDAGHRHVRVGVEQHRAVAVGDADVIVVDGARREPGEHHASRRGAAVGQVVDAVHARLIAADADDWRADDRGLDVDRRVGGEQQLLHLDRGDAGGAHADRLLEELHGCLRLAAEVARHVGGEVVQFLQAALQARDAVALIAAAQRDVAVVLRRAGREQALLHGRAGFAVDDQAYLRLEAAHGLRGRGGVGTADAAFEVIQILQALVQLAHAIAAVTLTEVDVARTMRRAGGVERDQRVARGAVGDGDVVLALEQLHGRLRADAEDAVRVVGQIAQIAQPLLHPRHAQPAVAAVELEIGIVGRQRAAQDQPLQLFIRDAVDGAAEVELQQADGVLRAPAEDAVDVIVVIAQVVQRLLNGADGLAAAAAAQRGILLGGLQKRPGGLLAVEFSACREEGVGRVVRGLVGKFNERKRRRLALRVRRIDVQQAAHRLDLIRFRRCAGVGRGRFDGEHVDQLAGLEVDAVDHPVRAQHEQTAATGADLAFQRDFRRRQHTLLHRRGVVDLDANGAARVCEIVDPAVEQREVVDVGVDHVGGEGVLLAQIERASVGDVNLRAVADDALAGNAAGKRLEAVGRLDVDDRAGVVRVDGDQPVRREKQPVEFFDLCVVGGRDQVVFKVGLHQLGAVAGGDVVQVGAHRARRGHVIGDDVLRERGQIQADQRGRRLAGIAFALAQKDQSVGIDGDDRVRGQVVDRLVVSGNE